MDIKEYTEQRKKSEVWLGNLETKMCMLCMGLAGESGEIVDYLKKVVFHHNPLDKEKLTKELGDMMWYFFGLLDLFNINLEDVLAKNIEKLNKRYPNGWNSDDSIKKLDEVENEQ